jgi:hypothetical protein
MAQIDAETPLGECTMSSPEELTFVLGRWLLLIVALLDVVRRMRAAPTSSREHRSTKVSG